MNILNEFHFIRPVWLLLLPLIGFLAWRRKQRGDPLQGWRALFEPDLLRSMTVGKDAARSIVGLALPVGWLLSVLAVSGPTWQREPSPFGENDAAVMIVLKATESMAAGDLSPNRQERARLEIADLARQRPGLPLGLIAYAGTAHLVLPSTRDTTLIASMAGYIDAEVMPSEGDDLAAALTLAADALDSTDTGGLIILMADAVQEGQTAALQSFRDQRGIPVVLLPILGPGSDDSSLRAASRLLDADIVKLSADLADTRALIRRAETVPVRGVTGNQTAVWQEAGYWLVPLLVPLLLLGFRRRASGVPALAVLAICGLGSAPAEAGEGTLFFSADQTGQRLFRQGEYLAAAEAFVDARWKGAAYYRAGEFALAEQSFAVGTQPEDFYNRGNALLMQGKYADAVRQYDRALELRPSWRQAADNRQIASIRAARIKAEGGEGTGGMLGADDIVFDSGDPSKSSGTETVEGESGAPLDDKSMEAMWLRNVRTEPGDFLRAKFSYQVAERAQAEIDPLPARGSAQ